MFPLRLEGSWSRFGRTLDEPDQVASQFRCVGWANVFLFGHQFHRCESAWANDKAVCPPYPAFPKGKEIPLRPPFSKGEEVSAEGISQAIPVPPLWKRGVRGDLSSQKSPSVPLFQRGKKKSPPLEKPGRVGKRPYRLPTRTRNGEIGGQTKKRLPTLHI